MSKMLFENVDAVFTHIDELSKKRNAQPVYYRGQHHNLRTEGINCSYVYSRQRKIYRHFTGRI